MMLGGRPETSLGATGLLAVAAALLLASCTTASTQTRVGVRAPALDQVFDQPDHHEQLRRDLRAIFTDKAVDHGLWSVSVQSLKRGETLYSFNSFRLQVPASNQK